MFEPVEPPGPESSQEAPGVLAGFPFRRPSKALLASVLIAAVAGGAVAAGVTLALLRVAARPSPQAVNLSGPVTISDDTAAVGVAEKAAPAVVSLLSGTPPATPAVHGSGFWVSGDGYLVTGVPTVAGVDGLGVLVGDRRLPARIVAFDCGSGLAVLKVDQVSNLPTLGLGDASTLRQGETVVTVAGPVSQGPPVSRAVVSGLHQAVEVPDPRGGGGQTELADVIETDAPADPTGAGGPLLNVSGQVVGVTIAVPGRSAGFALASTDLAPEVDQIVSTGQLQLASLGAQTSTVLSQTAALSGTPAGARISALVPGGPADQAGLRVDDVITQVDDAPVSDAHPLSQLLMDRFRAGQRVTVTYRRAGALGQVQLDLIAAPPPCP